MPISLEQVQEIFRSEQGATVVSPDQVPGSYEQLTVEWLTSVIARNHPEAEVVGFALGEPDDGSSNRRRIHFDYNDAGQAASLPSTVFCKAASTVNTRLMLAVSETSRGEVNFYNTVRDRLNIRAPRVLYAGYDPRTYAYFVMMEDLGGVVTFVDENHVTTRAQAESMVETLAELHSSFYEHRELRALPFPAWPEFWPPILKSWEPACTLAATDSMDLMPARVRERRDEIWPATLAAVEAQVRLPQSLVHSDVHLRNWFLGPDGKMGLYDWQIVAVGNWSRDFAYAITTALTTENRRKWEADLLALYLEMMADRGVPGLSLDEARRNISQQLLSALAFWTITLRPMPGMPDMQPESASLTFLERFYAAIDDHSSLNTVG
ncbi:aminoglycoside phosphotransferase family protein [Streptomyces hirsutus]|uniref:aminoglycoside phosphotransferase family protein n=1 Tax=Streptomyces hirsutus TaxID=35620 RepID=UPI0036B9AEAC